MLPLQLTALKIGLQNTHRNKKYNRSPNKILWGAVLHSTAMLHEYKKLKYKKFWELNTLTAQYC